MAEYSSTNKVSAYRTVAYDYNAARTILYQKKLAYGEAGVCPFYYPNQDSSLKSVELMEGIGSLNGGMLINCNIMGNSVVLDDAMISVPDSSTKRSIKDAIADIYDRLANKDSSIYTALTGIQGSVDRLLVTTEVAIPN